MKLKNQNYTLIFLGFVLLTGCASAPSFKPSKADRAVYFKKNNIDDQEIIQAMQKGMVIKGMTMNQVKATWGKPNDVANKYTKNCPNCNLWFEEGEESWYYKWNIISGSNKVVRFKDGIVVDVTRQYK